MRISLRAGNASEVLSVTRVSQALSNSCAQQAYVPGVTTCPSVTARDARRARGQSIGRPKALDQSKMALAQRMHASGESANAIAATLGVSCATVYRVLAENEGEEL